MKQINQINSLFDKLIKFVDDFKSTTKMIRYRFMNQNELQQIYVSNIKRLRLTQNLSQAELAERVGISVTFMCSIETGKKWGSFQTLADIATALGVEPYELLLPPNIGVGYDDTRTRDLMKRLRQNLNDTVTTIEDYLKK